MNTDDQAHDAGELVTATADASTRECDQCCDGRRMVAVQHGFVDGGKLPYVQMRCSAGHLIYWGEPGRKYTGGPLGWRLKVWRLELRFRVHLTWLRVKQRAQRFARGRL